MTTTEETDIRRDFAAACADGDSLGARRAARALLALNSSGATSRYLVSSIRGAGAALPGLKPLKLGLLSSFSAEFLSDALVVAGLLRGLAIELYVARFNQFRQEILDRGSGLYAFAPDAVIVSVLGEQLCPGAYESLPGEATPAADAAAELAGLLETFRGASSASVLVQNLLPPTRPLLGVGDAGMTSGQRQRIHRLNAELASAAHRIGGVYVVDYEGLVARHGATRWHDPRMRYFAELPIDKRMFLPLAAEYAKILDILAGGAKKCLVVDLDNTLWGGILGEDGLDGLQLGTGYPGNAFKDFQRHLKQLRSRGILLAIASKNNPADVAEAFAKHPHMVLSLEDFAAVEIGWTLKSESIAAIARDLGIGLEHVVFLDDNPVECAEVSRALPMVETIVFPKAPERWAEVVAEDGFFDQLRISKEDLERGKLYRQRAAAESLRTAASSLEGFYRGLAMEIAIAPLGERTAARAAQLTQKTNQLNLTTRRYTEAQLQARAQDPAWSVDTIAVSDAFGDNGIVGVVMAHREGEVVDIDTFLLSCRVIGRTVETAMLAHLCDLAERAGAKRLRGTFIPTAKNEPVRPVLPSHGFAQVAEDNGVSVWELDVARCRVAWPPWFRLAGLEAA
ncbi:MAG: HAD-IIIC family phosphatase [Alphaproteobacteria bacterium]